MNFSIEDYLHHHFPISQAMEIRVESASCGKVILFAPLSSNKNDKGIGFGGSLHNLAMLTCWGLLFLNMEQFSETYRIVIASSSATYNVPVVNDFKAECLFPEKKEWERFLKMLASKGKGRVRLSAKVYQSNTTIPALEFHCEFAVSKMQV